jgi:hypothetical protein
MDFNVLGEFGEFTLFYEENYFGGIQIYSFLRIWAGSHVSPLRRGTNGVHFGNLLVSIG